jgi:signal transduction histidine kinase
MIEVGKGIAGRAFRDKTPQILSKNTDPSSEELCNQLSRDLGIEVRSAIAVPLKIDEEEPVGVIQIINKLQGEFNREDLLLLDTIAALIGMARTNANLLEESNRASQLLGMGKVAHDIKNLAYALEANVLFSDQTLSGLRQYANDLMPDHTLMSYLDAIDGTFEELTHSIERVKRYSALISDLSSGKRLKPMKKLAPLAQSIQIAAAYLESEGRSSHVALRYDIQHNAPPTMHDEMYVFRIVQNLVSNAIKAAAEKMPERIKNLPSSEPYDEYAIYDEVYVRYHFKKPYHVIEIEDHGPGMTREMAERILTGNAMSSWYRHTGSGWGTKIALELAATHHAKVNIESELGKGTVIRVYFPHVEK